jgi:hypothetical protein
MWGNGTDQLTGQPAIDQRLAFNNNFMQLRSLFTQKAPVMPVNAYAQGSVYGSLTRNWWETLYGSTQLWSATAQAEIAGNMAPTMSGRTKADFTVDLLLASPWLYGPRQSVTVPSNGNISLTNKGDSVVGFDQDDGFGGVAYNITFNGPLVNPALHNVTADVSVSYTGTVASGHYIKLNVLAYTAVDDGGNNHLGAIAHNGARPWMALIPGQQTLALTADSGSGNAVISFQEGFF